MNIRANKIRIYPTPEQEAILVRRMGAARFVYNWSLARWREMSARGEKPSGYTLAKQFRAERPAWFAEMDSALIERATANLQAAFRSFFVKRSRYPQFKRKGASDRHQVKAAYATVADAGLKIPKCPLIRMARHLFRVGKMVGNVTISRTAGRWYASIPVECELATTTATAAVGIDLGLTTFATLSDGAVVANPRYLRRAERRLSLSQRRVSRAKRGSKNRERAKARLARRHASVANKRKGFLHAVTTDVSRRYSVAAIEDLNTEGMKRNRRFAKSVSDASFREFRRQLEYKMPGRVFVVDRFFPSSKLCSDCGHAKTKLALSERSWTCQQCGVTHDRDLNAAINLVRAIHPEFTPVEIGALEAGL